MAGIQFLVFTVSRLFLSERDSIYLFILLIGLRDAAGKMWVKKEKKKKNVAKASSERAGKIEESEKFSQKQIQT